MKAETMRLSENRWVAWIALGLTIVLCLVIFSPMALRRARSEAVTVFENGVADMPSLKSYILRAAKQGQLFANTAAVVFGASDEDVGLVKATATALQSGELDVNGMVKGMKTLYNQADALYIRLIMTDEYVGNATLQQDAEAQHAEIQSGYTHLDKGYYGGDYNDYALAFNRQRSGFPSALIAKLGGVAPLETAG